jgi:hypothetical protein
VTFGVRVKTARGRNIRASVVQSLGVGGGVQPAENRRDRHTELVKVDGVELFVEVADGSGPRTVGIADALAFDGVRDAVEAIAGQMSQVWDRVKPAEACVEFGLSLTAKTGRLTGLLVDGDGSSSLRVTLTWRAIEPGV